MDSITLEDFGVNITPFFVVHHKGTYYQQTYYPAHGLWNELCYRYQESERQGKIVAHGLWESFCDQIACQVRAGRTMAHGLWESFGESLADEMRRSRAVADLLRLPEGRAACRKLAEAGKAYGQDAEQYARRPVVREAVAKLAARAARRSNRLAGEAARHRQTGLMVCKLEGIQARRAEEHRKEIAGKVLAAANYRTARNGHTEDVRIGTPGVSTDTGKDWNVYRGSFKGWAATTSNHRYTVPANWEEAVYDRDLECVDGMLTLDAEPVQGHGPELYRAVWVEQGRGTSLTAVHGYIARLIRNEQRLPACDGDSGIRSATYTYHAASARAALDGVQRKAKLKPARRKGTLDLDRLVRRHGDLPVEVSDSFAVGNCESGTYSWCRAVGINPNGVATIAEVVSGYKLRPLPEVISVLRRVVRDRRNRQPVDNSLPTSSLEAETGRVIFDAEGGFRIEPSDN